MQLRKADEMEQNHNLKVARNAFMFYTVALIIWAMYDLIITGKLGWQMTILLGGDSNFLVVKKYFILSNGNER